MTDRRLQKLLPVERWPTRAEAEASRWFSPVRIGPHELHERTWIPAMVPWRATDDGFVTPGVLAWYERFAKAQPGAIVVEATGIRDIPSGPLLRAGADRYVEGLAQLVQTVKRASAGKTKLYIQLIDFLAIKRRPAKEAFFRRFFKGPPEVAEQLLGADEETIARTLSPRDLEAYRFGLRERVTDTHLPHIAELPRVLPGLFSAAARRCLDAGFDGVELHFAHAYTMASFLSALNTRTDGYGGPRENRVKLPLEVYRAVRAEVGTGLALGCRFLADEIIDGGNRPDAAAFFGVEFARAGMDFISLSRGGKFEDAKQPKVGAAAYPYTGPSGHECMPTVGVAPPGPWGRNLGAVAQVKRAVVTAGLSTPVVACGGISTFAQAEDVLTRGDADVVASARQALADPDWMRKIREGRGAEIRRCFFTNYCEGLDQAHEVVTCQRWDRLKGEADDATVARTSDGRRMTAP